MKTIIFNNNNNNNNIREKFKKLQKHIQNKPDISNSIIESHDNYNTNLNFINRIYLNDDFPEKKLIITELKTKLNSYKQQDIKKNLHEKHNLITIDDVVEKLIISKLKCYYCNKNLLLLYSKVRDNDQWTLDRLNNYDEHTKNNTIICCLKCNLERRRKNSEKFKFTKQLQSNQIRIIKSI